MFDLFIEIRREGITRQKRASRWNNEIDSATFQLVKEGA